MALDAVVGSPTGNSYLTIAEASALLTGHLGMEAWYSEVDDDPLTFTAQREAALMTATRLLDVGVRWYGYPTSMTQALAWPQAGQVDRWGRLLPSTTIPRDILLATALYAVALLADASGTASTDSEVGIKSKKVGDVTITYQDQPSRTLARAGGMPPEVRLLLQGYGMLASRVNVPLFRT
jgi:hypothetical protein